jgi:hypothetical protein
MVDVKSRENSVVKKRNMIHNMGGFALEPSQVALEGVEI